MNPEVRAALDALQAAFAEFRRLNDQRLATIEARGSAPAELEASVNRANADITAARTELARITAAQHATETVLARIEALGGRRGDDDTTRIERANALALFNRAAVRDGRPQIEAVTDDQLEQARQYGRGFRAYVRRGAEGVPADIRAAMTIGTDPEGGYFVPPDLTGRVAQLVYETSPMRQFASVSTTSRPEKKGRNDLDEAGGGWAGETTAPTETTTPKIGEWKIPIFDQYAEPRISQNELDDADYDVDGWLVRKISDKLSRLENTAFISGNGVTRPRGYATYANGVPSAAVWAVIEQTKTGVNGGFHATLPGDVFLTAIGLMKEPYRAKAVFAMNRTTEAGARKLKDGQGNYLWQPNFQAGGRPSIQGFPVALFEDMAAMATNSLSIAFANFAEGYEIVDRKGLTLVRDNLTAKPWIKFYTTRRLGGDVVNFEAIKLIQFAA